MNYSPDFGGINADDSMTPPRVLSLDQRMPDNDHKPNQSRRIFEHVAGLLLIVNVAIVFANIVSRNVVGSEIAWAEPLSIVLLSALAFVGAIGTSVNDTHMRMAGFVVRWTSGSVAEAIQLAQCLFSMLLLLVIGIQAISLWNLQENIPELPGTVALYYVPMTVGCLAIAVVAFCRGVRIIGRRFWPLLVYVVLSLGAGLISWTVVDYLKVSTSYSTAAVILAGLAVTLSGILFGFEIYAAIGLGGLVLLLLSNGSWNQALVGVPTDLLSGVDSDIIVTVPFFVFVGFLIGRTRLSKYIVGFLADIVPRGRVGSGILCVVAMLIFSGVSGSKIADIAAVFPALRPHTARAGYKDREMVGIMGASAIMGEVVPPSIAMLVLASITTISTGALFLAGILPALIMALAVIGTIVVRSVASSRRHDDLVEGDASDGERAAQRTPIRVRPFSVLTDFLKALPVGLLILIVLLGILLGIASPTEVSAVAVAYGLLIAVLAYRVPLREIWQVACEAAVFSAALLFLLATARILVSGMTISGLTEDLSNLVTSVSGASHIAFELLVALVFVVGGAVFEGLPGVIVLAPIILPLAPLHGVNVLQLAIVIILSMGIGSFLPPFGVGYYMTCAIIGAPADRSIGMALRYVLGAVIGVVAVVLIPSASSALPDLFNLH